VAIQPYADDRLGGAALPNPEINSAIVSQWPGIFRAVRRDTNVGGSNVLPQQLGHNGIGAF
jgi:hypothetical protein